MAAAKARSPELAGHPLPWASATHMQLPCAWLHQLSVHSITHTASSSSSSGGSTSSATSWLRECPKHGGPAAAGAWGAAAPLLRELWSGSGLADEVPALTREALVAALGPDWIGLPPAQAPCLLSSAPSCAAAELASWAGYYRLRGLPLESPAALLLDAVLTLHAAVVRVQQQLLLAARHGEQATAHADLPAAAAAMAGGRAGQAAAAALPQPLVLHLLGPRRELDAWPLLLELGCLLPPGQRIELHLVGPEVPPWAHGRGLRVGPPAAPPCGRQGCSCGRQAAAPGSEAVEQQAARVGSAGSEHAGGPAGWQTLFFWRGAWHEVAAEVEAKHGAPHAVVAPNAGLAAFMEWIPTGTWLLLQ
ncbi:Zinc finger MYND domain-containing 15 [Micractinium conductrix]|uniref:Zinc finger MYND domain-containing 15 n=1 Tax=Micractinium conductrix TaxID=554055 RepID=A0A2P6VPE4_9CHLO|nr:Zinc finger MYND domain-containing 15 [Micractinium conductrix]|eukprot:PSC75939.1 Zinc finger MYND domain-containing 15 [Micractinium conductrix]